MPGIPRSKRNIQSGQFARHGGRHPDFGKLLAQEDVIYDRIFEGRSYTVMTSEYLTPGSWITLPGGSITNNGDQRTVTDPAASATKRFYKVEIVKP